MSKLYDYVSSEGVILPDTENIKTDVETELKNVFGSDIDLSASTPQGRLVEAETISRMETLRICSNTANMINPNLAYGTFLDAICSLTGCFRKKGKRSIVDAVLTGDTGIIAPAGIMAKTVNGDTFYLENDVEIGANGSATGTFLSEEYGAIRCDVGELYSLTTSVLGLRSIRNDTAAELGYDEESDYSLKVRRNSTLYSGRSFLGDLYSRLANIENVTSFFAYNNTRSEETAIKGIRIAPHSVYTCVKGGSDEDVANTLYQTVSCGCGYSGDVSYMVTDPFVNQQYEVKFSRPNIVICDCRVSVKIGNGSGDVKGTIRKAIQDFQAGNVENIDKLGIGDDLSPFEIASAINIRVPNVFVNSVRTCKSGSTLSTEVITINLNEVAQIPDENVMLEFV